MALSMIAHVPRACTRVICESSKSMSSKTVLVGLSIFRCSSERSVHGKPSWKLAPYEPESARTKDFTSWCRHVANECCFNSRAGECGVVLFSTQVFVLDKAKSILIRIGKRVTS